MRHVQLRAFHYVATKGGFSRAADALNITQPAVSEQIRKLETRYDVLLFNRYKRQVVLTPTGAKLLEITNRMFENERQAQDLLEQSSKIGSGRLRIIADSAHHINPVLARFRADYPAVNISVRTGNSEEVIRALFAYEADIGVLGEVPHHRNIDVYRLGSSPIIAFSAKDFALPTPLPLDFAQLNALPLVLREQGSKTRQKLESAAQQQGITLTAAIEIEGREAVREVVATGLGIGFVSAAEYGHDTRLRQVPLANDRIMMEEALVCLSERRGGKLISAFMARA